MFVSQYNMVTGQNEWEFVSDDYDYTQEIARSDYGDMLHDTDRNKRYYDAIRKETAKLRQAGKPIRVLDIGTGSGLLSMMALKCGADHVTACEAFKPVAECAEQVLKRNGLFDRVNLIPKRSTELVVGVDLPERANLLVAEVFDTELIGEGALETFRHAAENLLTDDAVLIPHAARLYAIPVHSEFLWSHNRISSDLFGPIADSDLEKDMINCPGSSLLHDIQASQLSPKCAPDLITPLVEAPVMVKRFDFFPAEVIVKEAKIESECKVVKDGSVHAFVMWWDLLMESKEENVLSMAPDWAYGKLMPWRDHWMHAIYYPGSSKPLEFNVGDSLGVLFQHDEFSLAFDAFKPESGGRDSCQSKPMPMCECGIHYNFSRSRIARLATPNYDVFCRQLASATLKHPPLVDPLRALRPSVIVCISDSSRIPLACLREDPFVHVVSVEINESSNRFTKRWRDSLPLSLSDRWMVTSTIEEAAFECKIIMATAHERSMAILGEPYFSHATLPWHGLTFFFYADKLRELCPDTEIRIMPSTMNMHMLLLNFDNLHKMRLPVKNCEGFDLTDFDEMIIKAVNYTDGDGMSNCLLEVGGDKGSASSIEAHPLWEYPSIALSEPELFVNVSLENGKKLKMNNDLKEQEMNQVIVRRDGVVNGIAVWTTWEFKDNELNELAPSGGLVEMSTDGSGNRYPIWDRFSRQGACFLYEPIKVERNSQLEIHRSCGNSLGEYKFNFPHVRLLQPVIKQTMEKESGDE